MKRLLLSALLLPLIGIAQEKQASQSTPKNIFRVNLSSLVLKNYHVTYERALSKKISLSVSYRLMPKGSLPFKDYFDNSVSGSALQFNGIQVGNSAITPELRFYLGKGTMKGFYLAPYARFASFEATTPINYTSTGGGSAVVKTGDFVGKVTSTSAGIMLGWQFNLSKKLVMDLQLIGGHFGSCSGNLALVSVIPLSAQEQTSLQSSLNDIKVEPFDIKTSVNANGANIQVTGPWAGIRGANIGIGFRF
ncbi:MAG: DUF3575 domain-containing protein [Sediminibacterium sp.]